MTNRPQQPALEDVLLREALGLDESGQDRVHRDTASAQRGGEGARERELGVLRRGVGAGGCECGRARDGDEVDHVRGPRRGGSEARQERPRAPHAAEVVDLHDATHEVEVDGEVRAARGHPRVVDEQVDRRMASEDPLGHGADRVPVGDVAQLDLAADLRGERP